MAAKDHGRGNSVARRALSPLMQGLSLAAAIAAMGVLHGCGGAADDAANDIACSILNCKNSTDVALADLTAIHDVIQENGRATATSILGYRSNVFTQVRLVGSDSLAMGAGAQSRRMLATDSAQSKFIAAFEGQWAGQTISVDFVRGTQVERSTVTLPPPFVLVSPVGPVNLSLSAAQLLVDLSAATNEPVLAYSSGSCQRADGSTFQVSEVADFRLLGAAGSGSRYRLDTASLDAEVNAQGKRPELATQSKVTQCDLSVSWRRETVGTPGAGLYHTSRITGSVRQAMSLHYDALS